MINGEESNEYKYMDGIKSTFDSSSMREFISPIVVFVLLYILVNDTFQSFMFKMSVNLFDGNKNFNNCGSLVVSFGFTFVYLIIVYNVEKLVFLI